MVNTYVIKMHRAGQRCFELLALIGSPQLVNCKTGFKKRQHKIGFYPEQFQVFGFPLKKIKNYSKKWISYVNCKNGDSKATRWFKTFKKKIFESRETNYIKMCCRVSSFNLYSETELIPPSVSELEKCV